MRKLSFFIIPFLLLGLFSCQKVIPVKLNPAAQQYVIEAEVNDGPGPYAVSISRTKDFTENNSFEQISGARVIITDVDAKRADTLKEATPGSYRTSVITGVPGRTYTLSVLVNGQTFSASSTMPLQPVTIDSLYAAHSLFGGDDIYMVPVFRDPAGTGNYYRIRQLIGGTEVKGSIVRSDEALDGQTFRSQMFYDTDKDAGNPLITKGIVITAILQCINKQVYDYYRTLQDATGDNSSTPANPLTNITGGALGVFNTCITRTRTATANY